MNLGKKILGEEFSEKLKKEREEKEEKLKTTEKEPAISFLWYFLPFLFGFIGGLIGWALLREKSKKYARQLFIIGIFMTFLVLLVEWLK